MRHIKTYFFVLILSVFGFAQQQAFQFPKYALQFAVDDVLRFSAYYGSLFSAKYHFTNRWALRVGLSGRTEKLNTDNKNYTQISGKADSLTNRQDGEGRMSQIGINVILLKYFNLNKPVKFYAGIGPMLNYSPEHSTNKSNSAYQTQENRQDKTTWSVGLRGIYGVEWFFHSHMSLNMDYGLKIQYYWYNVKQTKRYNSTGTKSDYKRTSWSFNPLTIQLGLTVYL